MKVINHCYFNNHINQSTLKQLIDLAARRVYEYT